jgi:hypothetical protein
LTLRTKKSITIDPEIESAARKVQARLIEGTNKSWSVSIVLNILVLAGLAHAKKLDKQEWQEIISMIEGREVKIKDSTIADVVKKML